MYRPINQNCRQRWKGTNKKESEREKHDGDDSGDENNDDDAGTRGQVPATSFGEDLFDTKVST